MQNTTLNQLITYLESLGQSHSLVSSTYLWDIQDLNGNLRSNFGLTAMLIDSPDTEEYSDTSDVYNCALTFVGKPNTPTNQIALYQNKKEVQSYCLEICKDFQQKLKLENTIATKNNQAHWLYGRVVKGSFKKYKVGPMFTEQLYGYRLEFQITSPIIKNQGAGNWS